MREGESKSDTFSRFLNRLTSGTAPLLRLNGSRNVPFRLTAFPLSPPLSFR